MAKLMITTQVYENYGSADVPYWKAKGGNDYVVENFTDFNEVQQAVVVVRQAVESDDEYYREFVINWFVAEDDYLTEFERSQLEYDGRITYPAQKPALEEIENA